MQLGDGRVADDALLATLRTHARDAEVFDMTALAREAGTVISAVMFGALAASALLPFPRAAYEDTIRRSGKGVDASLRGFALAFERRRQPARAHAGGARRGSGTRRRIAARASPALTQALRQRFPAELHEMLRARPCAPRRVPGRGLCGAVRRARSSVCCAPSARRIRKAVEGHATTRETARWLALWMAFDDIVRVAELKLRASRSRRVRREVGARDDEIVKVYDHFKPGVPEFAALLPQCARRAP